MVLIQFHSPYKQWGVVRCSGLFMRNQRNLCSSPRVSKFTLLHLFLNHQSLFNRALDTTEQTIRDQFAAFGNVIDVFLPTDRYSGRSRGFGFVTLSNKAEADAAIASMDQTELDGRTIKVVESKPKGERESYGGGTGGGARGGGGGTTKLYVGNLSYSTDEDAVRSLFESAGTVTDCYLPSDRETGKARGFAFVTMSRNDANAAIEQFQGYELDGRSLRVNEAQQRGSRGRRY